MVGRRNYAEASFTRNLRYEIAGDEGRALIGSYGISFTLGIIWLVLVYVMPARPDIELLHEAETPPIDVRPIDTLPPLPEPEAVAVGTQAPSSAPAPKRGGGGGSGGNDAAIAGAFGANGNQGGVIGDVSGALRGVEVASGPGGAVSTGGGKVAIGVGQGGSGTRTPGRGGGFGSGLGTGAGTGLGTVGGTGGGIGRAVVSVAAPRAIRVDDIGGPGRDVGELGSEVRSRQSQLQFCYQEYGLKANPNLAGTLVVSVTLTGSGSVTGVSVSNRTWGGPGASAAEECIRSKIMAWRFPSSELGGGTYSFPFNFTR